MKNKTLTLMSLSIFLVIAVLGIVSADMKFNQTSVNSTINEGQTSVTISFKLNNTGTVNYTGITWSGNTTTGTWSTLPTLTALNTGENISLSATLSSIPSTYSGTITANITATASGGSPTETLPILITVTSATEPVTCEYGNTHDNLRVKKIEFTNNGFSETDFGKDDEWFPIDEVTVEMTIENKGNEKIEDIEVEWGLYDPSADQWVIELDAEDEFDLKSDKDELITIDFTLDDVDVDLEDLEEGTYVFYVKATGYDNEFEEDICDLESEEAEIIIETDFVVLNEVSLPETTSCGSDALVSANVWNVGEDDQEGVYVNIYNKELKIDQDVEIGDVDAFSYEKLDATIAIPANALAKTYGLVFSVYDEDEDVYQNDYDDEDSVFTIPFKVTCTGEETSETGEALKTVVSASLESGGKAGQELVVKATITNLEDKSVTYTVSASGYTVWASSSKIDQSTFILASGESKSVLFTFNVKDDVQGEQTFGIDILSGGKLVTSQPVLVEIEKKGFSFSQFGESNYIWAIALINVLLVVVIIIVAIKVMKK